MTATHHGPVDWVPVEQRWLGMDRRALVPAVVVAVFVALAVWVLPALNAAVQVDDPVRAGDVVQLGETTTFAPAAGWNLASGIRQGARPTSGYPGTAQVTQGSTAFSVVTDDFDGTPRELLAQIQRTSKSPDPSTTLEVDGKVRTFTTTTGQHGVIAPFTAAGGVGLIAAFVFDGTGVEVVASSAANVDAPAQADLVAMLESIQPVAPTGSGS